MAATAENWNLTTWVAKLVAGRKKDHEFAWAVVRAGLVDAETLRTRAVQLDVVPAVRRRVRQWIDAVTERLPPG